MRLKLRLERQRIRRWHVTLVERLKALGHGVMVDLVDGPPAPDGLDLLLDMERRLLRRGRPLGCDKLQLVAMPGAEGVHFTPDVTIDFTHGPEAGAWFAQYDDVIGEDGLWAALFAGVVPVFELVDGASRAVLERGHASTEAAVGTGGGLDAVVARLVSLLIARVTAVSEGRPRPALPNLAYPAHGPAKTPRAILLRKIITGAIRAVYRLCCDAPHWRVGWRYNEGPDVLDRRSLEGPAWRVLPDPGGVFYADPFPVTYQGREAIFFEDLDHKTNKGIISVVLMGPHGPTGPAMPVIDEPWHLSYPFLIEQDGVLYMIPESSTANDLAVYRCIEFPLKWERVATLIEGAVVADATIFRHDGRWWMTGVGRDGAGGYSDMLEIYSSDQLFSGWTAHPLNPILVDRATARPAGNVVTRGGKLWRPIQDCSHGYGMALKFAEITRLDMGGFEQVIHSHIDPGGPWPGRKLHSWNKWGRIEAIDGSVIRPKTRPLRALAEWRTAPPAGAD